MFKFALGLARRLHADSLYRNSFYLMAGNFFMAGIGFLFWLIASRLYTPDQIGLTTTFVSAASLVTSLALLGVNTTLIRFLPTSERKAQKINTALTLVTVTSLVFGGIFLLGVPYWSSRMGFLISSWPWATAALIFFVLSSLNNLTDSIFMAFRETQWVLVSNVTQSLVKLTFLVLLPTLGVLGLTTSIVLAVGTATALSLVLVVTRYKIVLRLTFDTAIVKTLKKYALGNYIAGFINSLPSYLVPIIITQKLGPANTAYYYMASMIISFIGFIPSSISRSNFAEGSQARHTSNFNLRSSLKATYLFLIPVVIVLAVGGGYVLRLFGHEYSQGAYQYLLYSLVAVLIAGFNYQGVTVLLVNNLIRKQIYINTFSTALFLSGVMIFSNYGIVGIGWISIITQSILAVVYLVIIRRYAEK